MDSQTSTNLRKAIVFDRTFVDKVEAVLKRRTAQPVIWAASLRDETTVSGISSQELLSLNNTGSHSVVEIEASAGNVYRAGVALKFTNRYDGKTEIRIKGEFNAIQQERRELEALLDVARHPWWLLRDSRVVDGFCVLLMVSTPLAIWQVSRLDLHHNITPAQRAAAFFLLFLAAISLLAITSVLGRTWRFIFPMVEFYFEGGIAKRRSRKAWRYVLIVAPLTLALIPWLRKCAGI